MCRLSAVIPRKEFLDGFSALITMMIDNARKSNKDGYGISIIDGNKVETFKEGKDFTKVIGEIPLLKFAWEKYNGNEILVGHVRAASAGKGKICDENAHPFTMENITLAHNGHFGNYEEINKEYKLDCTVDSQTFLTLLVKELNGKPFNIEAFNKVAEIMKGSYAFIIFDKLQPNKIFLAVGSNNITIYESDYAYLVNTEKDITDEINGETWCRAFITGYFYPYKAIETKSGTLYSLDSTKGLVEIGKIKLNPFVNSYSCGEEWDASVGGHSWRYKNNVITYTKCMRIDWNKICESVSFRARLLKSFPIGNFGLAELLENLPLIPGEVSNLDKFWCELLTELLDHLKNTGYLNQIDTKRMMWLELMNKIPNFYEQIALIDIHVPYFMNTLERLTKLKDELVLPVDKPEINHAIG